ncbi:MAG TPA: acyl-CoA dehydrogenase family protein [Deltaproteobacteria bacterium]|nr:acyl-CoA dehydrogenase family protein [Deltaproteobacteria bacterium]
MAYDYLDLQCADQIVLNDDHEALKKQVRKFVNEVVKPASIELDKMSALDVIKEGSPYWTVMRKMHELGYHTIFIPEELGGIGLDPLGLHIFFEEMAAGSIGLAVACGVDVFPSFFTSLILPDYPELEELIIQPYVADRDCCLLGCWAITEPEHGSDILTPYQDHFHNPRITHQLVGKPDGDDWILNGQKAAWVSNGTTATMALLFFGTDPSKGLAGGGIAIADLTVPGVSRGKALEKIGQRDLPQGEIYFDDVRVPKERIVCTADAYEQMTDLVLGAANAHMAVMCLGGARAAFEETLTYTRERVQGGKPLCEHQDIQRRLAEMFIEIEAARQLSRNVLNYNLWSFPPHTTYSMVSKIFCSRTAFDVAQNALQIFGGNGLSKEYHIEKLFRDITSTRIEDGSNETLTLAVGHEILFGERPY